MRSTIIAFLMLFGACATRMQVPDLGALYNDLAKLHGPDRNPVVVIPGVLGSRLVDEKTGTIAWGAFGGDYADPRTPEGARLIALPMKKGAPLQELRDNLKVDGSLDRIEIRLFGLPLELQSYAYILATLGVGGYRDQELGEAGAIDYGSDHFTCFQFAYDWRRDLAENARTFHEFLLEKSEYVKNEWKKRKGIELEHVKFDIVAHSMGGLLTRYYLRYGSADLPSDESPPVITWAGAELVDRAVLVGAPNAGAVKSLHNIVEGISFSILFPRYPAAILGTFPSLYQLMPRVRHRPVVDAADPSKPIDNLYDPKLWREMKWGLANPEEDEVLQLLLPEVTRPEERRAIAFDQLQKCLARAERIQAALDAPATLPEGLNLCLFAGDAIDTPAISSVDRTTGELQPLEVGPGDGSVLRSSALMDERHREEKRLRLRTPIDWTQVTFLFQDHIGLTKDPVFTDNMLYLLLEDPR